MQKMDYGDFCAAVFKADTLVQLTAMADPGFFFAGWSGACGGIDPCVLKLTGTQAVNARFEPIPPKARLTIKRSDNLCKISYAADKPNSLALSGLFGKSPKNPVSQKIEGDSTVLTYRYTFDGSGRVSGLIKTRKSPPPPSTRAVIPLQVRA